MGSMLAGANLCHVPDRPWSKPAWRKSKQSRTQKFSVHVSSGDSVRVHVCMQVLIGMYGLGQLLWPIKENQHMHCISEFRGFIVAATMYYRKGEHIEICSIDRTYNLYILRVLDLYILIFFNKASLRVQDCNQKTGSAKQNGSRTMHRQDTISDHAIKTAQTQAKLQHSNYASN